MATVGDGGDTIQFTDFISKNLHLYKISHGYHLSAKSAAHFTRKTLADYIRTNTRYQVAMLLAGYDAVEDLTSTTSTPMALLSQSIMQVMVGAACSVAAFCRDIGTRSSAKRMPTR